MPTFYTLTADIEIELDPERPETVLAAGAIMARLLAGEIGAGPNALPVKVTASKPRIVNRRESKDEADTAAQSQPQSETSVGQSPAPNLADAHQDEIPAFLLRQPSQKEVE